MRCCSAATRSACARKEFLWQAWYDDQWDRAWQGLTRFENHPDILTRPMDAAQIALVCVLGYADFRFPDCGWHKAFPKLDAFHNKMLQRGIGQDLRSAKGLRSKSGLTQFHLSLRKSCVRPAVILRQV